MGAMRRWSLRLAGVAVVCGVLLVLGAAPVMAFKPAAHYVLVEEVVAALPGGGACALAVSQYPTVAAWAANGPDLGYAQPRAGLDYAPWADRFHYDRVASLAKRQLQQALASGDRRKIAWATGWLTHVVGDMAVHGLYVNPECGVYLAAGSDHDLHGDLETWAEPYAWVRIGGHSVQSYQSQEWLSTCFTPRLTTADLTFFHDQVIQVYGVTPTVDVLGAWTDFFLTGLLNEVGYENVSLATAESNLTTTRRTRLESAFAAATEQAVTLLTAAETGDYSDFSNAWNLDASATDDRSIGTLVVTIHTSNEAGAGTNDDVYFGMRLADGTQREWKLDKPWYDDFEQNDTDDYYLFSEGVFPASKVTAVWVRKSPDGWTAGGWKFGDIDIRVDGEVILTTHVGQWLEDDHLRWEWGNLDLSRLNNPPVATPLSVTTREDTPVQVTFSATDRDGDLPSFLVGTRPQHGSLGPLTAGTRVTYTPDRDFVGVDTFTYKAYDGRAESQPATVTVTVTSDPAGDEPNDDPQTATRLTPGAARAGFIDRSGDADWFYLDLPAYGGPHQVSVYLDPPTGETYTLDIALCARGGWEGLMWPGWSRDTMPFGVLRAQGSAGAVRLYVVVRGEGSSDWSSQDSFSVRVEYTSSGSTVPSFPDIAGYKYSAAVVELAALGVVGGFQDGRFGPNDPVKRAQFAKMIALTMHLPVNESLTSPFTDLGADDPTDLYPHEYVAAVASAGITTGTTPTTFAPWNNIGLAQLVTMIVRAAQSQLAPVPAGYNPPFQNFDATHYPYARIAVYHGLFAGFTDGYSWFSPATRGQCALLLVNLLHAGEE
ncbi:MAG: S-layer homology domain-containing protein [Thermoleophilia bacterium]